MGDVQKLPFEDGEFDAAVAAWMLYHVPDVDPAIAELYRVLRPGGRLVAVTNSVENLIELWSLVGEGRKTDYAFGRENGAEILGRRFARVERLDADGEVTFPDWKSAFRACGRIADPWPSGRPYAAVRRGAVLRRRVSVFVAER